jgi:hypothetical protein
MEAQDYTIKYPLDAVHVEKFAELIGKPKTAVEEMIKAESCRSLSCATQQTQRPRR